MGRGRWRWLRIAAGLAAAATLLACADPQQRDPVGTTPQRSAPVPAGPHLYCISNVGHTLLAVGLSPLAVLPETARYLELDPVGPWFAGGVGYYLSRVETSGAGANALIAFDPVTTAETGRLKFPANANPNSLLLLPGHPGLAWVALRGSTFDNFATDGIAVVELATLTQTAFCDLNADTASCARLASAAGLGLTSPLGFRWDAGCGAAGCAYTVVNNFDSAGVRDGLLLALEPDAQGRPTLRASAALGRNPLQDMVLDARRNLWVVNNGGFVHFDAQGRAGRLQALAVDDLAADPDGDGLPGRSVVIESAATCAGAPRPDPGCDPTGIYSLDGQVGWLTTYPDDVLRRVELAGFALDAPDPALPRVTGPFFPVTEPAPALFAALGGLGLARLGRLDAATLALLDDLPLQAGAAPLSCSAYTVP